MARPGVQCIRINIVSVRLALTVIAVSALLMSASVSRAAFTDPYWTARVAGLGGAYAGLSDDAAGIFYNAAGTAKAEQADIQFTYAKLFAGVDEVKLSLNNLSYIRPMGAYGVVGLGWGNFTSADLYREDTVLLSYSLNLKRWTEKLNFKGDVSAGVGVRYLRRKFDLDARSAGDPVFRDGSQKQTAALDAHLMVSPEQVEGLSIGLSVKGINRPDVSFRDGEKLPMEVTGGFAYRWRRFTIPVDVTSRSGEIKPHFGVEAAMWREKIKFRIGSDKDQLGSGIGYEHQLKGRFGLGVDYSFLWPFELANSAGSHRASVGLKF